MNASEQQKTNAWFWLGQRLQANPIYWSIHVYTWEIYIWFLLNKQKSDCIYHLPTDMEPNEIQFGAKSIGEK